MPDNRLLAGAHEVLHRLGIDLVRFPGRGTTLGRRIRLLRTFAVDLVVDVGANEGQYGRELRSIGYRGALVSLEPLRDAYRALEQRARGDESWRALNIALGDFDGPSEINVAGNSVSSSLLRMLPLHVQGAPDSDYVGRERVQVHRLDSVAEEVIGAARRPFLKLDAQGFERRILEGADKTLPAIVGLQVELQPEPLYEGAPAFTEMLELIACRGFSLMGLEPGFMDPTTGRVLAADGLWFRQPGAIGALKCAP